MAGRPGRGRGYRRQRGSPRCLWDESSSSGSSLGLDGSSTGGSSTTESDTTSISTAADTNEDASALVRRLLLRGQRSSRSSPRRPRRGRSRPPDCTCNGPSYCSCSCGRGCCDQAPCPGDEADAPCLLLLARGARYPRPQPLYAQLPPLSRPATHTAAAPSPCLRLLDPPAALLAAEATRTRSTRTQRTTEVTSPVRRQRRQQGHGDRNEEGGGPDGRRVEGPSSGALDRLCALLAAELSARQQQQRRRPPRVVAAAAATGPRIEHVRESDEGRSRESVVVVERRHCHCHGRCDVDAAPSPRVPPPPSSPPPYPRFFSLHDLQPPRTHRWPLQPPPPALPSSSSPSCYCPSRPGTAPCSCGCIPPFAAATSTVTHTPPPPPIPPPSPAATALTRLPETGALIRDLEAQVNRLIQQRRQQQHQRRQQRPTSGLGDMAGRTGAGSSVRRVPAGFGGPPWVPP